MMFLKLSSLRLVVILLAAEEFVLFSLHLGIWGVKQLVFLLLLQKHRYGIVLHKDVKGVNISLIVLI